MGPGPRCHAEAPAGSAPIAWRHPQPRPLPVPWRRQYGPSGGHFRGGPPGRSWRSSLYAHGAGRWQLGPVAVLVARWTVGQSPLTPLSGPAASVVGGGRCSHCVDGRSRKSGNRQYPPAEAHSREAKRFEVGAYTLWPLSDCTVNGKLSAIRPILWPAIRGPVKMDGPALIEGRRRQQGS